MLSAEAPVLHAHWDYSDDGHAVLSAQAMFSASLRAVIRMNEMGLSATRITTTTNNNNKNNNNVDGNGYMQTLNLILRQIYPAWINLAVDTTLQERNECFFMTIEIDHINKTTFSLDDAAELINQIRDHAIESLNLTLISKNISRTIDKDMCDDNQQLSFSLPLLSPLAIQIIKNASSDPYFEPDHTSKLKNYDADLINENDICIELIQQYALSVGYIVGTVWCLLDCLNVRSCTCSPIPFDISIAKRYSNLLIDVPIQLLPINIHDQNNSFLPDVALSGIILLKELLLLAKRISTSCQIFGSSTVPPPMQLVQSMISEAACCDEYELHDDNKSRREKRIHLFLGCISGSMKHEENTKRINVENSSIVCNPSNNTPVSSSTLSDVNNNDMILLETNIDDMTPEYLAFAVDLLLTTPGVADVWTSSITMKKGRSAHTLHCLCHNKTDCDNIMKLIFQNTTTLGIRVQNIDRVGLKRTTLTVPIMDDDECHHSGQNNNESSLECTANDSNSKFILASKKRLTVDIKVGYLNGEIVSMKAEFDHCKEIALVTGIPIQEIASSAITKAKSILSAS